MHFILKFLGKKCKINEVLHYPANKKRITKSICIRSYFGFQMYTFPDNKN